MALWIRTPAVPVFVMLAAACLISGSIQPAAAAPEGYQRLSAEQLDEMLGPVALYPDLLLAQMLPAATYPTEIAAAADWVKTKGGEGLDAQNWDDTVKSVARYPEVLAYMNDNMEWTTALGQAFINQRADVMDSIQQLRAKAKATGALTDTAQQKVVPEGEYLRIVPAQPDVIYVPSYNPDVVYVQQETPWVEPFLTFGAGLLLGSWLDNDWYWPGYGLYHHGYPYWNWHYDSGHYHGWSHRGPGQWPGYHYPEHGYTGYHQGGHPGHWRNPSWAGGQRYGGQRYGGHGRGGQIPTGFEGGAGGRPGRGPGVGGGPGYRRPGPAPNVGGGPGGRGFERGPGASGRSGIGPGMGTGRRTGRTGTPPGSGQFSGRSGAPYTRPPSSRDFGRQGGSQGGAFGDYGRGSTAARSGARGRQSISGAGGSLQSPTGRSAFGSRYQGGSRSYGGQRPTSFGGSRGTFSGGGRTVGGGAGRMSGGGGGGRMGGGGGGRMGGGGGGRMGGGGGRMGGGGRH